MSRAEEIAEQVVLSDFVGCVVVVHSYRYSPWGMRAKRGGPEGEVDAQLIVLSVLSGPRVGEETEVYIEDEGPVSTIREQLLGNFDGPLYGRVEEDGEILFLALDPIEESMCRAVVTVVPA